MSPPGAHQRVPPGRRGNAIATTRAAPPTAEDPPVSRSEQDDPRPRGGPRRSGGDRGPWARTSTWRVLPAKLTMFDVRGGPEPMARTNAIISALGLLTFSFGLATLIAAMTVGWVMVTRAFQPLRQVEATAARIADGDLSQRMEGYNLHTRLGQLSASSTRCLGHIEDAFDARTRSETSCGGSWPMASQ
ncbi:hypothetical protein QJS66_09125 [Kocuria rhizophila]|nr:hypothetical protein QJS66_09125 [Kocuria rhizophila]